ncbi:MAG: hypothetical protein IPH39_02570 [Sulfuritalea sp.]|nr:hypothetical protein [Sulfuritalea sp.]
MSESEKVQWAEKVFDRLLAQLESDSRIVFLAGDQYRKYLHRELNERGIETRAPLSELGIGRQVAWLQKLVTEEKRLQDTDRLYSLLQRLAATGNGARRLKECDAQRIPKQGVYFFWEGGQFRMTQPFDGRVVRIGTHAVSQGSKATLWNRLRTHRGGQDGSGNHRGSIFRLHVGQALLRKTKREEQYATWGIGQSASQAIRASEEQIEQEVSAAIGEMPVLWLNVSDSASPDSDRAYLERNLIGLLAGPTGPLDLPSVDWLGHWSTRDAIPSSGLWNVNHVFDEYDPKVVDVLEEYVEMAEGKLVTRTPPFAPANWRTHGPRSRVMTQQLNLV